MEILRAYSFQIVALGTVILAITSSLVGSINLYKGQSLIGDAMGHSTLSGVIIAYMLFATRNPVILLLGAMTTASISYFMIEYAKKNSKIGLDANMAIYLSGFFGLGLVLKSYIQGNINFVGASQAGLDNYIFGQAAYLLQFDVILISICAIICTFIIAYFFKEFKVYLFDREFAMLTGIPVKILDYLVLFMTILTIGVGIKAVGVILISSFLIMPCVSARRWSDKYINTLIIGAIFSMLSALVGSYLSTMYKGFSTGPVIILVSGIIFLISLIFGKNGIIRSGGR